MICLKTAENAKTTSYRSLYDKNYLNISATLRPILRWNMFRRLHLKSGEILLDLIIRWLLKSPASRLFTQPFA